MIGIPYNTNCTLQPAPSVPPLSPAPPKKKKILSVDLHYVARFYKEINYYTEIGEVQTATIEFNGSLQVIDIDLLYMDGFLGEFKSIAMFSSFKNIMLSPYPNPNEIAPQAIEHTSVDLLSSPASDNYEMLTGAPSVSLAIEDDSLIPYSFKKEAIWLIDPSQISMQGIEDFDYKPTYVLYRFSGSLNSIRKK